MIDEALATFPTTAAEWRQVERASMGRVVPRGLIPGTDVITEQGIAHTIKIYGLAFGVHPRYLVSELLRVGLTVARPLLKQAETEKIR